MIPSFAMMLSPKVAGGGGGGGDPDWANVVSLLHFDGADASTTFTDATGKTWTADGNAKLSTATSKFGASSGTFDGTGDRISATHSDLVLGTGDFTIELFFNPRSGISSGTKYFFSLAYAAGKYIAIGYDYAINKTSIFAASGLPTASTGPYARNTFHHLAFVRTGTMLKIYINGVLSASGSGSFSSSFNTNSIYVGGCDASLSSDWFDGNIDEFRITKGVARYTANFTPPTAPFPNS